MHAYHWVEKMEKEEQRGEMKWKNLERSHPNVWFLERTKTPLGTLIGEGPSFPRKLICKGGALLWFRYCMAALPLWQSLKSNAGGHLSSRFLKGAYSPLTHFNHLGVYPVRVHKAGQRAHCFHSIRRRFNSRIKWSVWNVPKQLICYKRIRKYPKEWLHKCIYWNSGKVLFSSPPTYVSVTPLIETKVLKKAY